MDPQFFTRSFLQAIPEQLKQKRIEHQIEGIIRGVREQAGNGKTSYTIDGSINNKKCLSFDPTITLDEYILAIQKKFPDCGVSIKEILQDIRIHSKESHPFIEMTTMVIVIDWS